MNSHNHPSMNSKKILSCLFLICFLAGALYAGKQCESSLACCEKPKFSFGLMADVQYADKEPSGSRYYRKSLEKLQKCVQDFNNRDLKFVIQLGDLIDEDATSYGNLNRILNIYNQLKAPSYHVLGNHDFSTPESVEESSVPAKLGLSKRFYDFSYDGFLFIVLDSLDLVLKDPASVPVSAKQQEAKRMWDSMKEGRYNKHNCNGGIGKEQFAWLKQRLQSASASGQRVILFSHMPLFPANWPNLWNDVDVINLMKSFDCVVAFISGHNHEGAYAIKNGIHYFSVKGIVETPDTNAYAVVKAFDNRLEIKGFGRDRVLNFPEKLTKKTIKNNCLQ